MWDLMDQLDLLENPVYQELQVKLVRKDFLVDLV